MSEKHEQAMRVLCNGIELVDGKFNTLELFKALGCTVIEWFDEDKPSTQHIERLNDNIPSKRGDFFYVNIDNFQIWKIFISMKDILNHSGEEITIEPQLSNQIPFRTEIPNFPNYTFYPHEGKIYSHNQERFIGYYDKARIEKCNRTKSYTQVAIYNNRRRLFGTTGTLIWLSVFGSVPDGYEIHHIDGDAKNNKISNLMLVTREQHQKIHRRDYAELYGYLIYTDNEGNEKIFQTTAEMTEETGYKRHQIWHGLKNRGILKGRVRRTAGKLKKKRDEAQMERN